MTNSVQNHHQKHTDGLDSTVAVENRQANNNSDAIKILELLLLQELQQLQTTVHHDELKVQQDKDAEHKGSGTSNSSSKGHAAATVVVASAGASSAAGGK